MIIFKKILFSFLIARLSVEGQGNYIIISNIRSTRSQIKQLFPFARKSIIINANLFLIPPKGLGCENDPLSESIMAQKSTSMWETDYRIPSDTRAEHYDLYLHPNLDGDDFKGHVGIDIVAEKERDFFVVHTKYLKVTSTELKSGDGSTVSYFSSF